MNDFEIWRRISHINRVDDHTEKICRLYVPAIEPVGDLPYELAGLLPNREHRKDLMSLIERLPVNKGDDRSIVGTFAADPFLNCKQVAGHLIVKGYRQVANILPIAGYGDDFLSTLDKVSAGKAQENRNISQFVNRGLSISPAITTSDCLQHVLAWSPCRLWIVPSFSAWLGKEMRAQRLLEICSGVARKTDIPVILSAAGTGISVKMPIGREQMGSSWKGTDGESGVYPQPTNFVIECFSGNAKELGGIAAMKSVTPTRIQD